MVVVAVVVVAGAGAVAALDELPLDEAIEEDASHHYGDGSPRHQNTYFVNPLQVR